MVLPERLMPGRMANAWARPIPSARLAPRGRLPAVARWDRSRMAAVTHNIAPTKRGVASDSMASLNPRPTAAAGTALSKISPV